MSIVSQHMNNPNENHLRAGKKILRYLTDTLGHGWLLFKNSSNIKVSLYIDEASTRAISYRSNQGSDLS